jgi:spore germination protein PF
MFFYMSGFPIPVQIGTVTGGVVQFGPSLFTSPKSSSKTFTGAGINELALNAFSISGISVTNTIDTDGVDQPIVQDN